MSGDLMNCKNCGAPLSSYPCKCEYCGTVYGKEDADDILVKFESGIITANEACRMIGLQSLHDLERERVALLDSRLLTNY